MRLIDVDHFERRLMFTVDRDEICDDCLRSFLDEMRAEPKIDPVRRGRFVKNDPDDIIMYCSECLMPLEDISHYCPYCGAEMMAELP